MQLIYAEQIANCDCRIILDPDICYIQDHRISHLVGTDPVVVIHVFESLAGFVFLSLRSPVLSVLPVLLRPHRRLLSGIIVWVIFLTPDYLLCFVEVFYGQFWVESL
jgi:hypothetical protein